MEAKVSHKENKAWVTVDGKVTDEMLEEAVRKAGQFTGKVISRETESPSTNDKGPMPQ